MSTKRKAAPVENDQNGNPMISAYDKGNEILSDNQTAYTQREFFEDITDFMVRIAPTAWPPADQREQFTDLYFIPAEGRCVLAPDNPAGARTQGFMPVPFPADKDPTVQVCLLLEYHRVKRIYMVGTGVSKAFRRYCTEKGVEICRA